MMASLVTLSISVGIVVILIVIFVYNLKRHARGNEMSSTFQASGIMTARQVKVWAVIVGACLVIGAAMIVIGLILLQASRDQGLFILPPGGAILLFGVLMIFVVRSRRNH